MRLIDFFVFYQATLYRSSKEESRKGNQRLGKAVRIAGIIIGSWLFTIIELTRFMLFTTSPIKFSIWLAIYLVFVAAIWIVLSYVYITKERFQYIISKQYKAFTTSKTLASVIGFFTLMISVAIVIIIGVTTKQTI